MKNKGRYGSIIVPVTDFKYDDQTGVFTCYGNVKNFIDHANDRSVDGCFINSIERHKTSGTMPKQLWSHDPTNLPVGPWLDMKEDDVGLWMKGRLSPTTMGKDIKILARDKALDSFSIGYRVIREKWNYELNCNDLLEVEIVEVSWVNFACNEESRLVGIKSKIDDGKLPTKRELQKFLQEAGFSKRQAEAVTNHYEPKQDTLAELAKHFTKADFEGIL